MIECTLIIRAEKIGYRGTVARTIYIEVSPTIGMEVGMRYSTEKNNWQMYDLVFVQITRIICFLDDENRRMEEPIQMYATINLDDFPNGLDHLRNWWKHLDDTTSDPIDEIER